MGRKHRLPSPSELDAELLLVTAIAYILEHGGTAFLQLIADVKDGSTLAEIYSKKDHMALIEIELDAPVSEERDPLVEFFESNEPPPEKLVEHKELHELFDALLDQLKPIEAEVIARRFGLRGFHPQTLEVIGQVKQVTRERIRQIEANAIRKLKHKLTLRGINEHAF